jgi:hypothetical protein
MDEKTRRGLVEAAATKTAAAGHLKDLIVEAARGGAKAADIHRAIFPAYTYDYVAQLIRKDKAAAKTPAKDKGKPLEDCA